MLKALALATQLGFAVACPLVVFIAGGVWADGQLRTAPWLFFLGLVLGLVSAAAALYQIAIAGGSKRPPASKGGPPGPSGTGGTGGAGTNPASDSHSHQED